jgi:hypothetical protein
MHPLKLGGIQKRGLSVQKKKSHDMDGFVKTSSGQGAFEVGFE